MLSTVEGQLPTYPIIAPPPDYLLPALAKDVPAALGSELDLEIQTDVFYVEGARMASQGEEAL